MNKNRQIWVVCDHRVGELRCDEGQLQSLYLLPDVVTRLTALEEENISIRLLVPTFSDDEIPSLETMVPQAWSIEVFRCAVLEAVLAKRLQSANRGDLFVSSSRKLRAVAADAGLQCAPDVHSASLLLSDANPKFVHLKGEIHQLARRGDFVPFFIEKQSSGEWNALGAITQDGLAHAVVLGISVQTLALDMMREDPLLVNVDHIDKDVEEALQHIRIVCSEGRRLLAAVGPDMANDDIKVHGAHGHLLALWPDSRLLDRVNATDQFNSSNRLALARLPHEHFPHEVVKLDPDILHYLWPRCPATPQNYQETVDRYAGTAPLDASGAIVSRHYRHPDNRRAVDALVKELSDMGYCATRHSFFYDGRCLDNVIADLPGRGRFVVKADILQKLREILLRHQACEPMCGWIDPVAEILGEKWIKERGLRELHPLIARQTFERAIFLYPWYPWWKKLCPLYAIGAEIVIVGCHLDSTANFTPGFDPDTDAAPGVDDDASGIAATLSMARWFRDNYAGKLTHTVRFAFFNAEESGLIGSKAYAGHLKALNAPIRAVVCTDMIGYNSDANRIFEVHAGFTDPAVRDASVPIANGIAAWAASLGQLAPAQIYKGTTATSGADRDVYDGAINRSDHAAFHQQGYPAVVVSEDFFANLSTEPGSDPNPNYHSQSDTFLDSDYATDIVCAVAMAAKDMAS